MFFSRLGIFLQNLTESGMSTGLFGHGWSGGHFVTGQDWKAEVLVDVSEFIDIAIGNNHALAIKADGTLWAWGNQGDGKLGDGINNSTAFRGIPVQIGSDTNWAIISAGDRHSAAIKTTGTLWTWGSRIGGRLGDGNTSGATTSPTQIGSDTNWEDVSCGRELTVAVKGGGLYTCGTNGSYKTGLNTDVGSTTSFTLADATGWTKCYAGVLHGIGFKNNELWSWGANTEGRTGQGTTTGATQIPTQTTEISTGWLTGSAGSSHSMAIKTDGTMWYFGQQFNGRLGNGSTSALSITSPMQLGADTDWERVGINGNTLTARQTEQSYAIKGGAFYACGLNNHGQLGIDPSVTAETGDWTQVGSGTNYTKVGAGGGFALAIRA